MGEWQEEKSTVLTRVGQEFELYANQGMREAVVLAILPERKEALVEYTMPRGTTALRVVHTEGYPYFYGDTVPYTTVPSRFIVQMAEYNVQWVRNPQQAGKGKNGYVSHESPSEIYVRIKHKIRPRKGGSTS